MKPSRFVLPGAPGSTQVVGAEGAEGPAAEGPGAEGPEYGGGGAIYIPPGGGYMPE